MRSFVVLSVLCVLLACVSVEGMGRMGKMATGRLPGPFKQHNEVYHKNGLITSTYMSPPLPLAPGEVILTNPFFTKLKFPPGKIAIKSMIAGIADESGNQVPLSEVYNHHWVIGSDIHGTGNLGPCDELRYIFGIGAESRHTYPDFPDPYRYITHGNETWNANIHIIRTTNVPAVKQCIECHCGDISDPNSGGVIACCMDHTFCPTNGTGPTKTYYLKYDITWEPVQPSHIPVAMFVFDSADCIVEYNVTQCQAEPCVNSLTGYYNMKTDVDVVFVAGHLHIGAINGTFMNANTGETICNAYPRYGNGTEAGNEEGYLVEITSCTFPDPVHLPAGTTVSFTGTYDNNPYHDAVMSLTYVAVVDPTWKASQSAIVTTKVETA